MPKLPSITVAREGPRRSQPHNMGAFATSENLKWTFYNLWDYLSPPRSPNNDPPRFLPVFYWVIFLFHSLFFSFLFYFFVYAYIEFNLLVIASIYELLTVFVFVINHGHILELLFIKSLSIWHFIYCHLVSVVNKEAFINCSRAHWNARINPFDHSRGMFLVKAVLSLSLYTAMAESLGRLELDTRAVGSSYSLEMLQKVSPWMSAMISENLPLY